MLKNYSQFKNISAIGMKDLFLYDTEFMKMIIDASFKYHIGRFSIIQKVFNETVEKNLSLHG